MLKNLFCVRSLQHTESANADRSLFLPSRPLHESHQQSCEDHAFGALAGDEFLVRLGTALEALEEFLERVVDRVLGGEAESVGIERAVFFAREVIGFVGWKPVQVTGKKLSFGWGVEFVANEKAFGQQQISGRGDDRGEQDADTFFALVEKMLERFEGQREVSGGDGIS